jgi:uncharacterized membrane protein
MRSPATLLRVMVEFVIILVGAFILRVAVMRRYYFDRRSVGWLVVGGALVALGARSLWRAMKTDARAEEWIRGASQTLVGVLMLSIAGVPFRMEGALLCTIGGVLILRGLVNAVLALRAG